MATLAADHSTAGAIIGGTLKRDGYRGVVRYAAGGRGSVNIDAREYEDLKANGIPVAIVLEHEANWLLDPATVKDRVLASRDVTRAAGIPDGVIYLAADFDATNWGPTTPGSKGERQMQVVLQSINVAAEAIGQENVGFYGSYFAIDWLVHHISWIRNYWQTAAWSQGRVHPAACLYQRAQTARLAGVSVDVDEILRSNWGQRPTAPVADPAKPEGIWHFHGTWDSQKDYWTIAGDAGENVHMGGHQLLHVAKIAVDERNGNWQIHKQPEEKA